MILFMKDGHRLLKYEGAAYSESLLFIGDF